MTGGGGGYRVPRRGEAGRKLALGVALASLCACGSRTDSCSGDLFQNWTLQTSYMAAGASPPPTLGLAGASYGTFPVRIGPCAYTATVVESGVSSCVEKGGMLLSNPSPGCSEFTAGYSLDYTTVLLILVNSSGWAVYGL